MQVEYLAKANGILTATSTLGDDASSSNNNPQSAFELPEYPGNISVPISVTDKQGVEVVKASIDLYISERKEK